MIVQKDRIENYLKKTPREGKRGKKKRKESEPKNFERRGTAFCNMNRGEKKKEKNSRKAQFHASFFPTFLRTTAILFRVRVIPLLGRNPMKRKGPIGSKGEGWRTNEKAEEKKRETF